MSSTSVPGEASASNGPLWLDHTARVTTDGPDLPERVDVAVVGGGITGMTTAALLARAGLSVAVLEARQVGGGTTGGSTAKISLLQGTRLSSLADRQPQAQVLRYVEANRGAKEWLEAFCERRGVVVQQRAAVTFAVGDRGERAARRELDIAARSGLAVRWVQDLELPFAHRGGVQLEHQLQTDPVALVHALVDEARAHGATVHEGVRVLRADGSDPVALDTSSTTVRADIVVLACGMPILDRGGFFARMEAHRSSLLALRASMPAWTSMYLSADQPTRSLRDARRGEDHLVLLGGAGQITGRDGSEREHLDQLRASARRWWPDAEETHAWSAQDHSTTHGLPFAGPLLPGVTHLLVAGGFAKWGMTNGVASALALSARITGRTLPWMHAFEPWRGTELAGLRAALSVNGRIGLELARGWVRAVEEPAGELSRVCTHLGGIVRWNDAERSWDCPLHGSRFDDRGEVLDAPATCGLRRR